MVCFTGTTDVHASQKNTLSPETNLFCLLIKVSLGRKTTSLEESALEKCNELGEARQKLSSLPFFGNKVKLAAAIT